MSMLPAVYSMLERLPVVQPRSEFSALKEYFNKYHNYDFKQPEFEGESITATYTVIDPHDVKKRITDYLGKVLARCWIDPSILDELDKKPHATLLEMGVVLPDDLNLRVKRSAFTKRPRLVVYEVLPSGKEKRICYLELIMRAGR
jgi:hypothetical protein